MRDIDEGKKLDMMRDFVPPVLALALIGGIAYGAIEIRHYMLKQEQEQQQEIERIHEIKDAKTDSIDDKIERQKYYMRGHM